MITSVTEIQVRYSETDMMGVVYHANYLPWLEIGRTQLLKERGMSYKDIESRGLLLPVLEVWLKYRTPATYDDVIAIKTTLPEKPIIKIRMEYELTRGSDRVATGYSIHAFVNRQGQALRMPPFFLDGLNAEFKE